MTTHYVAQTHIGNHKPGDVFHLTEDHLKGGVDPERLTRLGSIRKADAEESKESVKFGESRHEEMRPIPPVPFDAEVFRPSPDPLRSESPPTLPHSGSPDTPTEVKGSVSHKPEPEHVTPEHARREHEKATKK